MNTKGFSYRRVIQRRDHIYSRALRTYFGARLVGDTIRDVCEDVLRELPQTVSRDALFESIRVLAGSTLTQQAAKNLAWRLAGNVDELIAGRRILPWTRQVKDEVVPVRVERVRFDKRKDNPGVTMLCRVLAGSPCPIVFPQFISRRSWFSISRTMGFSGPRGRCRFTNPLHFVNLLFFAHLEAERSGELPYFKTVSASSSLLAENRGKIAVRCRARPCPRGYSHDCAKCFVGYNECPAGVYPRTLVTRMCPQCSTEGFFEPDDESLVCINCRGAQHHVEQA